LRAVLAGEVAQLRQQVAALGERLAAAEAEAKAAGSRAAQFEARLAAQPGPRTLPRGA